MSAPRKICIVGLDSYGMLSGEGDLRYIGGESVQHVLLARAWRDLGHDVSMIVHDEGQGPKRVIDGITAIAAHTRRGGIPGLRSTCRQPQISSSLWQPSARRPINSASAVRAGSWGRRASS